MQWHVVDLLLPLHLLEGLWEIALGVEVEVADVGLLSLRILHLVRHHGRRLMVVGSRVGRHELSRRERIMLLLSIRFLHQIRVAALDLLELRLRHVRVHLRGLRHLDLTCVRGTLTVMLTRYTRLGAEREARVVSLSCLVFNITDRRIVRNGGGRNSGINPHR